MEKGGRNHSEILNAYRIYQKYYLRSVMFEECSLSESIEAKELIYNIAKKCDEMPDLHHTITTDDIQKSINYLMSIGFIKPCKDEKGNIDTTNGMITESGMKALQDNVLQGLATSAFFGYKSLVISNESLKHAKIAVLCAIVSILLALTSIVVSLCR